MTQLIHKWHSWLDMPKFDKTWHEDDLTDELAEYKAETSLLKKWSEASDVVYTCTRARWSGHDIDFPLKRHIYVFGIYYMLPKYTARFLFFRRAGKKAGANRAIRCVRNPKKTAQAGRHTPKATNSRRQTKINCNLSETVTLLDFVAIKNAPIEWGVFLTGHLANSYSLANRASKERSFLFLVG